nr:hypothetical protein [Acidobacteriota bacterium]
MPRQRVDVTRLTLRAEKILTAVAGADGRETTGAPPAGRHGRQRWLAKPLRTLCELTAVIEYSVS